MNITKITGFFVSRILRRHIDNALKIAAKVSRRYRRITIRIVYWPDENTNETVLEWKIRRAIQEVLDCGYTAEIELVPQMRLVG